MRVVSLLPSATEIVASLGGMDYLVGITHACDYPVSVKSLVRVTTTAINADATPGEIDSQVRAIFESGGALYSLLEDRIAALKPDLILTQALCKVCAVMETDVRALAKRLSPEPAVVPLSATTFTGVLDDIAAAGAALGLGDEAEEFLAGARARMRAVHNTLKNARAPRPRVAVVEWGDPIYAAGHWMPEMIHRAGGVDVLATDGEHSVTVTLKKLQDAKPDVIIIAPCGYDLQDSVAEGQRLLQLAEWNWAQKAKVIALDANAFASRPGPRLVKGIEVLARCFNPQLFSPLNDATARLLT